MRREESPFEYRGQWLGREPGRESWYRCWYNDGGRKVSRRSLRTTSLDAAKERLIEILSGVPTKEEAKQSPREVLVSDVLNHYVDHKYPPGRRAAQLVLTGLKTTVPYPKVADLTLTNQRRVWSHMHEAEGLKAKSISTYMIALRAAINYSARPQIVEIEGKAEEVQLLTETVPVICNEAEIADYLGAEVSEARQFLPTYEQVAKWIDAIEEEADFRYVMIALNTWARNSAIFELRVDGQVDFEYGLVNLNPKGRRQTKKRRPVIRLTSNLRGWLRHWNENRPIKQYQDTVEKRLNAMGAKIDLPDFVCYTLRHFMATQSRRTGVDVTREMRSKWLGHSVSEGSATTAWYEQFDPDFLEPVANATDEIIAGINTHMKKRRLFAPTQHPQSGLQVISGGKEN